MMFGSAFIVQVVSIYVILQLLLNLYVVDFFVHKVSIESIIFIFYLFHIISLANVDFNRCIKLKRQKTPFYVLLNCNDIVHSRSDFVSKID